MGVDEGVQRLVAFAVALGLPGADRAAFFEAGDDPFGGQLAEIVGVKAAGEVDGAGARLGQFQAGVYGVLHGIDTDDEQRDFGLVGSGGAAWPDRDGGAATALDCPDAAGEAGAAEFVGHLGVVATMRRLPDPPTVPPECRMSANNPPASPSAPDSALAMGPRIKRRAANFAKSAIIEVTRLRKSSLPVLTNSATEFSALWNAPTNVWPISPPISRALAA